MVRARHGVTPAAAAAAALARGHNVPMHRRWDGWGYTNPDYAPPPPAELEPSLDRAACDALFDQLDADGDGELTLKEIKAGVKALKAKTGVAWTAKFILKSADVDHDKSAAPTPPPAPIARR